MGAAMELTLKLVSSVRLVLVFEVVRKLAQVKLPGQAFARHAGVENMRLQEIRIQV